MQQELFSASSGTPQLASASRQGRARPPAQPTALRLQPVYLLYQTCRGTPWQIAQDSPTEGSLLHLSSHSAQRLGPYGRETWLQEGGRACTPAPPRPHPPRPQPHLELLRLGNLPLLNTTIERREGRQPVSRRAWAKRPRVHSARPAAKRGAERGAAGPGPGLSPGTAPPLPPFLACPPHLQLQQAVHERLCGGRAAGDVQVHGHDAVAPPHHAVAVVVVPAPVGAAAGGKQRGRGGGGTQQIQGRRMSAYVEAFASSPDAVGLGSEAAGGGAGPGARWGMRGQGCRMPTHGAPDYSREPAPAHGHDPARLRHLVVHLAQRRRHLQEKHGDDKRRA